jgi:hypothetical protein
VQSIRSIKSACKIALVLIGSVLALGTVASGQPRSDQRARSEDLTQALVSLNARYQRAGPGGRPAVLAQMLATAAERRRLLASMFESDPGHVLRVALTSELRASLPAAVRTDVEQHVELEGTLEVLQEDDANGARLRHFLDSGGTRLELHFATNPPGHLTGDRVRVRGVRLDNMLALDSGTASVQIVTTPPAGSNTFGNQRTLVLLVNFQDNPVEPYTLSYADGLVFTTTSNFDREGSYQQTWLTGVTLGWFTIAIGSTVCDTLTLASLAQQAATGAGINLSLYTRYVYAFPRNACTWSGMATVGGNPSKAWINGDLDLKVVGHEMGHNFGLFHAHALDCGSSPIVPPCTSTDYGDTLDIMGNTPGHFNAFMKERLGWLAYGTSPPIVTVQTDGTYQLEPLESPPGGGAKALKILRSTDSTTGKRTWFYVELRQAIGFDGFLSNGYGNVVNGVVIRTGSESDGNSSYLLDITPQTDDWTDPALDVGLSFTDPLSGVTLKTISVNSTRASVKVTMGGGPPTAPTNLRIVRP